VFFREEGGKNYLGGGKHPTRKRGIVSTLLQVQHREKPERRRQGGLDSKKKHKKDVPKQNFSEVGLTSLLTDENSGGAKRK